MSIFAFVSFIVGDILCLKYRKLVVTQCHTELSYLAGISVRYLLACKLLIARLQRSRPVYFIHRIIQDRHALKEFHTIIVETVLYRNTQYYIFMTSIFVCLSCK